MSSMPECTKCGDYVFHGPCLCEKCADSNEASKLRARAEAAEAKRDEAVRDLICLIRFVPLGWEQTLGWSMLVAQLRQKYEKERRAMSDRDRRLAKMMGVKWSDDINFNEPEWRARLMDWVTNQGSFSRFKEWVFDEMIRSGEINKANDFTIYIWRNLPDMVDRYFEHSGC